MNDRAGLLLVAATLLGIWIGGVEPAIRRRLGERADNQIATGDYGGCLATSAHYMLIILLVAGGLALLVWVGYKRG